jgi:hypothetical protein
VELPRHFFAKANYEKPYFEGWAPAKYAGDCSEQFEIHQRFVNKASDWTISKSNSLSNWIGGSFFLIVQSEALFTNLL